MRISRAIAPVLAIAFVATALILVPLLATAWISFTMGVPGQGMYSLDNYARALSDPFGYTVLANTVLFALGSSVLGLAIAAPLAWTVARTDLPLKHVVSLLMGMILIIPGFIQAMGWALLLSPNIGLVNQFLTQVLRPNQPPLNIYSLGGMAFVQGLHLVPPAFFTLLPVLMAVDASFEEAAYLSGASKVRTFLRINIPLAVPALMAAGIYVFILAFALFEVPAILGFPERVYVFSTMIYLLVLIQQSDVAQYGLAAAYGSAVVMICLLLASQYTRVLKQGQKYATITGKGQRAKILRLGRWRSVALALVGLYVLLALVVPLVTLLYQSLLPYFQLPSLEALQSMTLKNYTNVMRRYDLRPFLNPGILIAVVPFLVVLFAIPISWIVVRSRVAGRFVLDNVAFLPLAIPRVVLAVSLLYLALVLRQVLPLYGTLAVIAVAHIIMFLSFATRTLNGAMLQIHPELEEAGRVSGATVVRTLVRVTGPLLRPALFFSWFWVLLLSFREVTVAVMLSSPDNLVLPAIIWLLWNRALPNEAAAAAVILALVALVLMLLLRGRIRSLWTPGQV